MAVVRGGKPAGIVAARCQRCGKEESGILPVPLPGRARKQCSRCRRMVCRDCTARGWFGGQVVCKDCTVLGK